MKLSILATLICLGASGCYVTASTPPPADAPAPQSEVVYETPPAPPPAPVVVDPVPPSSGPDQIWIGGTFEWGGHGYDWRKGHYERRPHPRAVYVPGHWERRGRGHVWIGAHWN